MSSKKPTDEKVSNVPPFGLRMLPDLKERVANSAAKAGRSMNAEIISRLEASYANEADEKHIWLPLPKDIIREADIAALTYDQSLEEFIADAIKRELSHLSRFRDAFDELQILQSKIHELEEKLQQVTEASNSWRLLYEQRIQTENVFASLLNATVQEILSCESEIPDTLTRFAKGMRSSLNNSLKDLFKEMEE